MTGGTVVVLGETGRNFAAGMSHGRAFVLDETGTFPARVNRELVSLERLEDEGSGDEVRALIERHVEVTGSARGREILDAWADYVEKYWAVVPHPPQVDTESAAARVTSLSGNDSLDIQRPVAAARG
jgi:glutamate synthase domain-containing protein 3